ncbi:MAG TPA: PcfJ domain-containing protein [Pirellulaceae bacterium]|nr:PcfJ domain-containing protein [Pirellulaceae bacterium]
MSSTADTAQAIYVRDADFREHLKALGLASPDEYVPWCARRGFSMRLDKHWRERARERYFDARERVHQRIQQSKAERRNPLLTWDRVLQGQQHSEALPPPWRLIYERFSFLDDPAVKTALSGLLVQCHAQSRLITLQRAIPALRDQPGNTFAEGLIELAKTCAAWIRPISAWVPRTRNKASQFASLAAHLLARYPVPPVMHCVWFRGPSLAACQQRAWYLALAAGKSPRTLDFPLAFTRLMASHFQSSPKELLVEEALRRAQVLALGGNMRLARSILDSRLGTNFANNEFWTTVIRWFAKNPDLEQRHVAPLIDYIHQQKFEPQILPAGPAGGEHVPPPPAPEFGMQGRTAGALLHQMHQWHARLRNESEASRSRLEWSACGVAPFESCEGRLAAGDLRRWTIVELLSRQALFEEGRQLRHCVAIYAGSCAGGGTSIWSLGVERNACPRKRVLTIELSVNRQVIRQVRGKANRLPTQKEIEIVQAWALQERLTYSP